MNQRTKESVYAAIEVKVEAHLKRIHALMQQPDMSEKEVQELVDQAMSLLRCPIYH